MHTGRCTSSVLVVGASGGIGEAISSAFGRPGRLVGVHYHRRLGQAQRSAAGVEKAGGAAIVLQADLCQPAAVDAMMGTFLAKAGRLDTLICTAGGTVNKLLLNMAPDEWYRIVEVNLTGIFRCLRAAGLIMSNLGSGSIILVDSYSSYRGGAGQAAYAASKAGLIGLMRSAAWEWGPAGIRVNAVLPGWQATGLTEGTFPSDRGFPDHALRRPPLLDEVARTVVHLASLSGVSGQVWNLDSRIL